ncbi:hypothetical protein D3C80_1965870 [compost metagenome]
MFSRKDPIWVFAVHPRENGNITAQTESSFKRFCNTVAEVITDFKTIHHHFNGVLFLFIEFWNWVEIYNFTIDTCSYKTLTL